PAPRPQRSVLGTSKIQSYLGTSLRSWEEALADCLNQLRHG
ncbi:MAG: sugar nucleotide-binding protein, partial [Flavobacteriales bacterium]|nr:sugar nucleotide-binding protein [Flavobacteriales bacterium]